MTLAATAVVTGAAVGAYASSSGSGPGSTESAVAAGSSSASDPHEVAAQREADRILTTFQAPPGSSKAAVRPDPVPSGLQGPPSWSADQDRATSIAWYSTSQSPAEVLAWVQADRPAGSSPAGSGSGSNTPSFVVFSYPTPQSSLTVTPASGPDGRTVIRIDASVGWTPTRSPASELGYDTPSVSVVTTAPSAQSAHSALPARETRTVTATAPLVVHQIVDLLNALPPETPGVVNCPMDDGTRVLITLPGLASVTADPVGCEGVTITPQGGKPQHYSGGTGLITKVYALFGITWTRTGVLPPGIERTGASGTP